MDVHTKRKIRHLISPIRRVGLDNKDFSIISNNCWGGVIYDIFGLPYKTPTVGSYFAADDYIKFVSNLHYYLSIEVEPLDIAVSKNRSIILEKGDEGCPIGKLDDIEIVFAHYPDIQNAVTKWNKRRSRVDFDNLIVKYNEQNGFSINNYHSFVKLPYKNKVFFTANKGCLTEDYCVFVEKYLEDGYVVDDIGYTKKNINLKMMLNSINKGMVIKKKWEK